MPLTAELSPPAPRSMTALFRPIAGDLEQTEAIFAEALSSALPYVRQLVTHLGHYRGKRLRPALLLLAAKACGRVTREHHILAAVVEMIHTATLVHDDVLDNAGIRRHVATVNHEWGNAASVLLGDWLFTHAFHLASTTGSAEACRIIGEATNRVCEGELHQIGERGNWDLTEAEYFRIIDGKTAELTACCGRLGAWFSGAPEPTVKALARFGRALGIAFQIADDVLDLIGREDEVGKSLGTDLEQQKLTLPLIRWLAAEGPDGQRRLHALLASPGREAVRHRLEESGALDSSIREAERYARAAREELAPLPPSECRDILEELTLRAVHRSS